MRRLSLIMGIIFVVTCLLLVGAQGWMGELSNESVIRLERAGYAAIGWGTGVTAWLLSGHLATSALLRNVPKAWRLWQGNVLKSCLPVFKYLTVGFLFSGLGALLGYYLWGLSIQAFDVGLLVGTTYGSIYSLHRVYHSADDQIDFLEANQRYLNEGKVAVFSDEWS